MHKKILTLVYIIYALILAGCSSDVSTERNACNSTGTKIHEIAAIPQQDAKWQQVSVHLNSISINKDIKLPFITRIPPEVTYRYILLDEISRGFSLSDYPTSYGITLSVHISDITLSNGKLKLCSRIDLGDRNGVTTKEIIEEVPAPDRFATNEFSRTWRKTYAQLVEQTVAKIIQEIYTLDAIPTPIPTEKETRGYIAEMYINKNIHRVIIDTSAAKVYSVEDLNTLPVSYILYGIARGNGYKAATVDIDSLKNTPELLQFLNDNKIGIVLLNADRTDPDFEIENSRLADKMGAKGPLTYVLADKSGQRIWHTYGRLNIEVLQAGLPAKDVPTWVKKLYAEINKQKVDSLDWFTPFIDTNAY